MGSGMAMRINHGNWAEKKREGKLISALTEAVSTGDKTKLDAAIAEQSKVKQKE